MRLLSTTTGTGIITTVAGNGVRGSSGDGGHATAAQLSGPRGIALDLAGNIYIADTNDNRIRMVTGSTGIITTIAGNGNSGYSGDNGTATAAQLNRPIGVAIDTAGNIYIADTNNNRIRMITISTGYIATIAGDGIYGYSGDDGPATAAHFDFPFGITLDPTGNIYIADTYNNRIRMITISTGVITLIAGNGNSGYSGENGSATVAQLNTPTGVALDTAGNIYIADEGNDRIRMVTSSSPAPTSTPMLATTCTPSYAPTFTPSCVPTKLPTIAPTFTPSCAPTKLPTIAPTFTPSCAPTKLPTTAPTL